jgi:membrane-associated phospholipid phosphatase
MKRKIKIAVNKFSEAMALVSAEILLLIISFFISLSLLIIIIRQIFYHKEYALDERVFSYFNQFVNDTNTKIMQVFSFGGSHYFLVTAWLILIFCYYFTHRNKWMAIKMPIIALSNLLLMLGLKFFFNRPRPMIPLLKHVPGLSFPSGHAFMSFIFYGFLIYLIYHDVKKRWVKWSVICVLVFIILAIGVSRIYLRVHYTTDVVAGYCFGMISLLILFWLLKRIEHYNAKVIPASLNVTKT